MSARMNGEPMSSSPLAILVGGAWAVLPETLREIDSIYQAHVRGDKADLAALTESLGRPLDNTQPSYTVEPGGVAVLRPGGVLAPKANLLMQVSGGISAQMLSRQFGLMAEDSRVRSAVIAWDSPGGSVLGIPQAANALRALADKKPTVSVSNNTMASAAYWIGSAAGHVYVSGGTDMIGSLGVVSRIAWDKADANSMELVRGKYKRAGANGTPPSAEVVAYHEAQIDYTYTLLVDAVAANRRVSVDRVLQDMADGRVFIGQQAIGAGLADGFSTVDAMVERLASNPEAFRQRRGVQASGAFTGAPRTQAIAALPKPVPPAFGVRVEKPAAITAQHINEAKAFAARYGCTYVQAFKALGFDGGDQGSIAVARHVIEKSCTPLQAMKALGLAA